MSVETAGVVRIGRVIRADRQRVWDAWTRPEQMMRWSCPVPGGLKGVTCDLRVGGAFEIRMVIDGAPHTAFGTYREVEEPGRLVYTWDWREAQWNAGKDPRPSEGESLQDATDRAVKGVEALLQKYPGKNIVIVTHSDICAGLAGHAAVTPFPQRYKRHGPGLGAVIEIQIGPQGKWELK